MVTLNRKKGLIQSIGQIDKFAITFNLTWFFVLFTVRSLVYFVCN